MENKTIIQAQDNLNKLFKQETTQEKTIVVAEQEYISPLETTQEMRIQADLTNEIYKTNKLLVENTTEEDRKNIKLICPSCCKVCFKKEGSLDLESGKLMIFDREDVIETSTLKDKFGRKTKEVVGREYLFKCEVCDSKFVVQTEE